MQLKNIVAATATALVLMGIPLMAAQQKTSGKRATAAHEQPAATHPEVDPSESCRDCHEAVTPVVYTNWFEGAHGVNNVLCVVCHGGLDNFIAKPDATRCAGCHAVQVDTMGSDFMKGKTCFTCHPAHRLLPHAEMPNPDPGVADRTTNGGAK